MPDHHGPTGYGSIYEPSFETALAKLGLSGPNFDYFWRCIEAERAAFPWDYSSEVPDTEGIRVYRTRDAFQDIPPLLIYYRVQQDPGMIVYVSISPDWPQAGTKPP